MFIRELLRKALLNEGAHKTNKFGCVMVFLKYDQAKWDELQDLIDDDDLYEPEGETGFGKETEPHVTILYGLHTDIPDEDIEAEINKIKTPNITLGKLTSFTNPKFDVLKFDVDSDDLHKYNKRFRELPHTNDYPDYHPHCTEAYLKSGMVDKYIKLLNDYIEQNGKLEISVDKIVYSKADGTKKSYNIS